MELADKSVPREGVPVCPEDQELFLESGIKCPLLPPSHPEAQETRTHPRVLAFGSGERTEASGCRPLGVPGRVPRGDTLKLTSCVTHLRPHLTPVS